MTIAVVTDSTAYLPAGLTPACGYAVVPLHVLADDREYTEGVDLPADELSVILRQAGRLTTSRPAPKVFLQTYERLAAEGATGIVSVHLSAELSGTYEAACLAAPHAPVTVLPVDSGSMAMGLGYAVLEAGRVAADWERGATGDDEATGAELEVVADAARRRAEAATVLFCVDSLEHLRRGGRIGRASALLGGALSVKPLLALVDGHIEPLEKQRTATRALRRLADLAVEAVEGAAARRGASPPIDVTVHHLEAAGRAEELIGLLTERAGGLMAGGCPRLIDLGAVAAVHLGPGALGVVVSPAIG